MSAAIEGLVRTEAGGGVPSAAVEMAPLYDVAGAVSGELPCGLGEESEPAVTLADSGGRFSDTIEALSIGGPICVEVYVEPPEGLGLLPTRDSVKAEFALPGDPIPNTEVTIVLQVAGEGEP